MFQLETVAGAAVLLDLLGGPATVPTSQQDDAAGRVPAGVVIPDIDKFDTRILSWSLPWSLTQSVCLSCQEKYFLTTYSCNYFVSCPLFLYF